jgi:hypothetical protein
MNLASFQVNGIFFDHNIITFYFDGNTVLLKVINKRDLEQQTQWNI